MKSVMIIHVLAMFYGTNANFLYKIRDRLNPPAAEVSITSVPAPLDFTADEIQMPTTALNAAMTTNVLSTTSSFQVQLQTTAAEISPAYQEPLSLEPPETVESTPHEQEYVSRKPEAPTPKKETKVTVPDLQDASAAQPLGNQNVQMDASQNKTRDTKLSNTTSSDSTSSNTRSSDTTSSSVVDQSRTSQLGPSFDQNAQNSQSSSLEEPSNASDNSTTSVIIIGVTVSVVALAVFGIFFGIPTFKKWSSKDDSNLSNPNWGAIREERKKAELERYYDSFS